MFALFVSQFYPPIFQQICKKKLFIFSRLIQLRQLSDVLNLETILEEAAEATSRSSCVWGVFGHLAVEGRRLVVMSADTHVVR